MPSFQELFDETDEPTIKYKGMTLHWADKFPVASGDTLVISIEKTNSEYRQGLTIDITGTCEMDGELFKKGKGVKMLFWEDTAPKQFEMTVFTKQAFVAVQNVWEGTGNMGRKYVDSGHHGAAMIVEEIENGRRYRCNDGHPDENFDDIVFTVQRCRTKG